MVKTIILTEIWGDLVDRPEILDILTEKPEIWKINENRIQGSASKVRFAKINKQFDSQKQSGLAYSKKNLIRLIPNRTKIECEI